MAAYGPRLVVSRYQVQAVGPGMAGFNHPDPERSLLRCMKRIVISGSHVRILDDWGLRMVDSQQIRLRSDFAPECFPLCTSRNLGLCCRKLSEILVLHRPKRAGITSFSRTEEAFGCQVEACRTCKPARPALSIGAMGLFFLSFSIFLTGPCAKYACSEPERALVQSSSSAYHGMKG